MNFAVPLTLGELLIVLERKYGGGSPVPDTTSCWPYLWAYVGLRYLQSTGGLSALRDVSSPSPRRPCPFGFNDLGFRLYGHQSCNTLIGVSGVFFFSTWEEVDSRKFILSFIHAHLRL